MRPPGGPAGAQRRNDRRAGVIDAARRGKARAENGPAQAPHATTPMLVTGVQHRERIEDTRGRKGGPTRHSLVQDGVWQSIRLASP